MLPRYVKSYANEIKLLSNYISIAFDKNEMINVTCIRNDHFHSGHIRWCSAGWNRNESEGERCIVKNQAAIKTEGISILNLMFLIKLVNAEKNMKSSKLEHPKPAYSQITQIAISAFVLWPLV